MSNENDKKTTKTGILTSVDDLKDHKTGSSHFENPSRILVPLKKIEEAKIPSTEIITGEEIKDEILLLCHEKKYINFLRGKSSKSSDEPEDLYPENSDMKISKGTEKAARVAAGSVIKACDLVLSGKLKNSFCLVRPPGHHATKDKAMGFCFYNNVALAASYLISSLNKNSTKVKKVLIIDWDLHHGNGTQSFFEENENVFYFSTHLEGIFPNNPKEENKESKTTLNANIKSALCGMEEMVKAFSQLEKEMESFKPDFILISCGFDGHAEEKIVGGGFGLTDDDYLTLTKIAKRMAQKFCDGKIVSVLEGGYNIEALSRALLVHLESLAE